MDSTRSRNEQVVDSGVDSGPSSSSEVSRVSSGGRPSYSTEERRRYSLPAVIRSVMYTPVYLGLFFLLMIVFVLVSMLPARRYLQDKIIHLWAWLSLIPFGVHCHVEGAENVPTSQGFLYLFNHQSHFDIPVAYQSLPGSFRFGAKIELYRIPLFNLVLRRMGALPIARKNRTEVFKVYEDAKKRIVLGESFILAPEGTRQEKPALGLFKLGPFILAMGVEMPIVPVVMYGVHDVLAKGKLLINPYSWRHDVWVRILPLEPTVGLSQMDREILRDRVRTNMLQAYSELRAKSQEKIEGE